MVDVGTRPISRDATEPAGGKDLAEMSLRELREDAAPSVDGGAQRLGCSQPEHRFPAEAMLFDNCPSTIVSESHVLHRVGSTNDRRRATAPGPGRARSGDVSRPPARGVAPHPGGAVPALDSSGELQRLLQGLGHDLGLGEPHAG